MTSTPRISFLICSWQAPASLEETLNSIARQPESILFETVLINNGFSEEREHFLYERYPSINLRIVREKKLGLGYARCAGFVAVAGEFIVILDDDNTLSDHFVPSLLNLMEQYPQVGGICSTILPKWEITPPAWLQSFATLCLSYTAKDSNAAPKATRYWVPSDVSAAPRPPGGGMIIHRDVASCYLSDVQNSPRASFGRTGTRLESVEDYDTYYHLRFTGKGALETPELVVYHHIGARRIKLGYLLRLNYYMLYSFVVLEYGFLRTRKKDLLLEILRQTKSILLALFHGLTGQKCPAECLCRWSRSLGSFAGCLHVAIHGRSAVQTRQAK